MAAKSNDITALESEEVLVQLLDIHFHCAEHIRYQDKLKCPLKKEVWNMPCLSHITLVWVGMMTRFIHFLKNWYFQHFQIRFGRNGKKALPVNIASNNMQTVLVWQTVNFLLEHDVFELPIWLFLFSNIKPIFGHTVWIKQLVSPIKREKDKITSWRLHIRSIVQLERRVIIS